MAKILVVDDDRMTLKLVSRILLKAGYETMTLLGGGECMSTLRREQVDLLLMDIELSGRSGLELLADIRGDEAIADTRVLFMTSSAFPENAVEALRLGAKDFIRKPFNAADFYDRVDKALESSKKYVILAVDDEPINLLVVRRVFGISYEVVTAESGPQAFDLMKSTRPDLILLDFHMPGMNGLEVFRKLHSMEGYEDIPVVFLTADDSKETEVLIFKAGASDYLKKPMVPEVAIQRVNRIIELSKSQNSLQSEVDRKTRELQMSSLKVKNLSNQIMAALSKAIDAKDAYTNGHSSRVAQYSRELAIRMGYRGQDVDDVYAAGLLHDVGKIGVPTEIINKPGKLTDEEFDIIKSHTTKGFHILEEISELPLLSIGAHWHHERYDGRGYPDGIAGEDIPEIARIVCVADSYDAMTSKRSYRNVLPQEVVRDEIEKGMGTQFDPQIARLMLEMIDEDGNYDMREI